MISFSKSNSATLTFGNMRRLPPSATTGSAYCRQQQRDFMEHLPSCITMIHLKLHFYSSTFGKLYSMKTYFIHPEKKVIHHNTIHLFHHFMQDWSVQPSVFLRTLQHLKCTRLACICACADVAPA